MLIFRKLMFEILYGEPFSPKIPEFEFLSKVPLKSGIPASVDSDALILILKFLFCKRDAFQNSIVIVQVTWLIHEGIG